MRHRKSGRTLGRSPSHRKAMLRNLACSLFLTERDKEDAGRVHKNLLHRVQIDTMPKEQNRGRVVTTLPKAKEVRRLVEKCITVARRGLAAEQEAEQFATDAQRDSSEWRQWRESDQWQKWNAAISPAVTARRRALRLLGDKYAVRVLFQAVAPRFVDRNGGYTRVIRLADPRLGDAGQRAILELVGRHDRVVEQSTAPSFDSSDDETSSPTADEAATSAETSSSAAGEKSAE